MIETSPETRSSFGQPGPDTAGHGPAGVHGDLVVLVGEDGADVGTAPRASVHTTDTRLHRAFSAYLFDEAGRLLMTRRALHKRTWPGVWSNACCGHWAPGEDAVAAARRRVPEELAQPSEQSPNTYT